MEWKLADAKNKFSEVYRRATTEGPQRVTKSGSESVIIIAESAYQKMQGERPNFIDFLMSGPGLDDLEIPPREDTKMREVDW